MKIVCLVTDESHYGFANWLEPSCLQHDLELIIIKYTEDYLSHKMKDILLLEYLKRSRTNEVILFTDAYDTLLLTGEDEILNKFKKFNSPLIFSAEINCWPDRELEKEYPPDTSNHFFKYLNSGGFIGESQYIRELIEKYYEEKIINHSVYKWSNQYTWNQIYLREQNKIALDRKGEIFYTLSSSISTSRTFAYHQDSKERLKALEEDQQRILKEVIFDNNRLKSNVTQTSPCHVHFSSPTTKYLMQTNFFDKIKNW